jgi:hypothetical protein
MPRADVSRRTIARLSFFGSRKSGMSKSSLYYDFDDKAGPFATAVERSLSILFPQLGSFDPQSLTAEAYWNGFEERRCSSHSTGGPSRTMTRKLTGHVNRIKMIQGDKCTDEPTSTSFAAASSRPSDNRTARRDHGICARAKVGVRTDVVGVGSEDFGDGVREAVGSRPRRVWGRHTRPGGLQSS